MNFDYETIKQLTSKMGDSFYYLDIEQFSKNYDDLLRSFRCYYENTHIAYSYKTNYIPDLCKLISIRGGYAEIVSDMEYKLAKSINVDDCKIFYNGPYKSIESVKQLLLGGGYLNVDSIYEIDIIEQIALDYPNNTLKIGLRVNLEINDGVLSRFGFDPTQSDFEEALSRLNSHINIQTVGVHMHVATRALNTWGPRVDSMINLIKNKFDINKLEYISLGGGLYGNMHESLKKQFSDSIPSFHDYAEVVAKKFNDFVSQYKVEKRLKLIIEPGSALAGDSMKFVTRVLNIKTIRGKNIASLTGSIYNINPTLNKKNPPIDIIHLKKSCKEYTDLDFGGYTCIESDYLFKGYNGRLGIGDYVIFSNVGSYSVVLKPPFILPNFGIVKYENGVFIEVKRVETFNDVFQSYSEIAI